jgi:hypothetical protein
MNRHTSLVELRTDGSLVGIYTRATASSLKRRFPLMVDRYPCLRGKEQLILHENRFFVDTLDAVPFLSQACREHPGAAVAIRMCAKPGLWLIGVSPTTNLLRKAG